MGIIIPISLLIAAYLLGSIPWALIISRLFAGIDIRDYGSKNMGATNVLRVLGLKYGLIVFALDAIKAGIIIFLFTSGLLDYQLDWMILKIHPLIYGGVALIGHMFPVFANFKGGKGVASCAGIVLAYSPLVFIVGFTIFMTILLITKYLSLGSIIGTGSAFVFSFFYPFGEPIDWVMVGCYGVCFTFIVIRHISNIKRLIHHNENKTYLFKKKSNREKEKVISE